MNKLILYSESTSFTNKDIEKISHVNNIIKYEDLSNISTVDSLLGHFGAVVILYETKQNFGHWVCLFKTDYDTLEFFDSYGLSIDEELNFIPKYTRFQLNEITPHLTAILKDSRYKIIQNNFRLQQFIEHVNTCGRWVASRLRLRNLPLEEFIKIFISGLPEITADYLITTYTLKIQKLL